MKVPQCYGSYSEPQDAAERDCNSCTVLGQCVNATKDARAPASFGVFAQKTPERATATDLLDAAAKHMTDRASTYDQPTGERSMERAVLAFNAITGQDMTETQGWEFMAVLKSVRFWQNPDVPHRDSIEDAVAYRALMGESALRHVAEGG